MLCFDVGARGLLIWFSQSCLCNVPSCEREFCCSDFGTECLTMNSGINGIDISKYLYVCLKGLFYTPFKIPFCHWKDRTELERDKVREKVKFMLLALRLYGCLLCLCVVVSVIRWGCLPKGCSVCISIRDSVSWDQDKRGEDGVGWVWQRKASVS